MGLLLRKLLIVVTVFWGVILYGQNNEKFDALTIEDGLTNNSVSSVFQDNDGFLWFGTLNGLNRYDGKKFLAYYNIPGDSTTISSNKIRRMSQDKFGYLWIETFDNQVHRMDVNTGCFQNFPIVFKKGWQNYDIKYLEETTHGVMWMYLVNKGCVRVASSENSSDYTIDYFPMGDTPGAANVTCILADTVGGVWIGTENGLSYWPADVSDSNVDQKVKTYLTHPAKYISSIYQEEGDAWFGTANGEIYHLENATPKLMWSFGEHYNHTYRINFSVKLTSGDVCFGTDHGLVYFDKKQQAFSHFGGDDNGLKSEQILSYYKDQSDNLWLITEDRGVTRFNPHQQTFQYFALRPETRLSIVEGEKQSFWEDINGDLWIGIFGGGVFRFDERQQQFTQFVTDERNTKSLSSNFILTLFGDHSGNLWIGTYKRGLNRLSLKPNPFENITQNSSHPLNYNSDVRAMLQDKNGNVWVGNLNGDVYIFSSGLKERKDLSELKRRINSLIYTGVYALMEDQQGNIWIGTKGQGIFVLKGVRQYFTHKNTKVEIVQLQKETSNSNSLPGNSIYDLYEDTYGQVWVAVYHGGLTVIKNPLQPDVRYNVYRAVEGNEFSLSDNRVRCIMQDDDDNMWVGTANGLNYISSQYLLLDEKQIVNVENDPGNIHSLSNNDVVYLFQDTRKNVWAGTYGGGLNVTNGGIENGAFHWEHYNRINGLTSNVIFSILEDKDENLWLGTDLGLTKFDLNDHNFEKYYSEEGAGANIYSEASCLTTQSGSFLFGHSEGMVAFHPDSVPKSNQKVPVLMTDFLINGEELDDWSAIVQRAKNDSSVVLTLPYNQNFVTFEFAALDYKAPENVQYKYRLEEYEQEWNQVGNVNQAAYKGLKPDTYKFRLQATNGEGAWINDEVLFTFKIKPPLWRTTVAYVLYIIIITVAIWIGRKLLLERIHLKHQIDFEKQIADEKLKFYTSISHELKTPLSLILGPVEDIMAINNLPGKASVLLHVIKRNAKRLLELIDELMDFRKIQKGVFKVQNEQKNMVVFLSEIHKSFESMADKKGIQFDFEAEKQALDISTDYKSLEKIMFNLLSNAFKHTDNTGQITLGLSVDEHKNQIVIRVKDTGEGIRPENLQHIFDRFYHLDQSQHSETAGSGVGLSLTKELVELLQGEIHVYSVWGEGSTFSVSLPIKQELNEENNQNGLSRDVLDLNYTRNYLELIDDDEEYLPIERSNGQKKSTILVVEDNDDLRNYISGSLSSEYDIIQAQNGKEGLEAVRKNDVDLILCDIMMPEMDGNELTRILKKEFHSSHIPIVLLTAKSDDDFKIKGIEDGADDYITKPFSIVYLKKRIKNILNQRRQLKERFGRDLGVEPEILGGSNLDNEFITQVTEYIEENLANPEFSVESLVAHFQYGRTVFYKKMKGISGYSPKEYVSIIRMKKAGTLLHNPNFNVTQVAYDIGFNDASYFSKSFKKHFGVSPTEYQNNLKKQQDVGDSPDE